MPKYRNAITKKEKKSGDYNLQGLHYNKTFYDDTYHISHHFEKKMRLEVISISFCFTQ